MKAVKFFFVFLMLSASSVVMAQLKVDATGKAIFGKNGNNDYGISIIDESTAANPIPFWIIRSSDNKVSFSRYNDIGTTSCRFVMSAGGEIGIGRGVSVSAFTNIPLTIKADDPGCAGIRMTMTGANSSDGVQVKFTETSTYPFAAYRNNSSVFYINGTGQAYSNGSLLTSDISLKSNIEAIPNSLDKVLQLRGVTFDMNFPSKNETKIDSEKTFEYAKMRTPEVTREIFDQIEKEKTRKQMGVIAQEVEKVIPEVVRTREDGLKAVAYNELIGLLIEAIKELKTEVDDLRAEANTNVSFRSGTDSDNATEIANPLVSACKLYQNAPNPFREKTEIKYFLPQDIQQASVCIFDMQGKLLKKLNAPAGENTLIIKGSELHAGMYLYSLIADGKEVDTKRMILTK